MRGRHARRTGLASVLVAGLALAAAGCGSDAPVSPFSGTTGTATQVAAVPAPATTPAATVPATTPVPSAATPAGHAGAARPPQPPVAAGTTTTPAPGAPSSAAPRGTRTVHPSKPPKVDPKILDEMKGTAPTGAQAKELHAVFDAVVNALHAGDWDTMCTLYAPSVAKSLQETTGKGCAEAFRLAAQQVRQKRFAIENLRVRGDFASGHDPYGVDGNGVTFQRVNGQWRMAGYP